MDLLRRAMDKESIRKWRREGRRNIDVEGIRWKEQITGDFSETDKKDEGMSR